MRLYTFILLAGGLVAGCRSHTDPRWTHGPSVEIDLVSIRRSKAQTAFVDVVLRNHVAAARWFLLPNVLLVNARPRQGGANGVEVYAWSGQGVATEGHFFGNGGFHAFLVPPGAAIRVRELPITYGESELHDELAAEVVIASGFRIGGRRDVDWFARDPTATRHADVSRQARSRAGVTAYSTTNLEVEIDEVERIQVAIRKRPAR